MKNSSRFFENRDCRYFPCHKNQEPFNCLFCYCPFYLKEKCPGNPAWLKVKKRPAAGDAPEAPATAGYKIIKDCTNCTFPHRPESYDVIIDFIRKENETREFSREIWDKAIEV